jgi:putative drug exporter of the RND superfamily
MAGLARWCFRHRFSVIGGWVLLVVALGALTGVFGTAYSNSFSLPGTESSKALDLVTKAFPGQSGDSDTIVWHVDSGSVHDQAVQARMSAMLHQVAAAPAVASVSSPYAPQGAAQVSRDGRTAYATVTFTEQAQDLAKPDVQHVIDLAHGARAPGLQVELGGGAIEQVSQAPPSNSEAIGLLAAGVILFIAFGSLFAMALPLVAAVVALASGILAVGLLTHAVSIPVIGPTLAALIGLGVGIDYALFVVTRHRNGIKAGMTPEEAAVRSLNTSGRAVLFAGTTVCIALLGLLVLNLGFLAGLGISAAVTVLFTMATAITLLPALLGLLGMRVLNRKERRRLAAEGPHDEAATGWWARWATFVARRPRRLATAAALVMVVLALPVLSLRLGLSDAGNDPSSSTTRKAYDLLVEGFGPGFNGPLQLVAQVGSPQDKVALDRLVDTLRTEPDVAAVEAAPTRPGQDLAIVTVVPSSAPQDAATSDLITRLRTDVIPAATAGTSLKVYVGGATAIFGDFAQVISSKLPLFIAVIVGLGFLLLMVAFRSLLVPATAAVMNLLAAGAAFGVVVAVFQLGWGSEALGLGRAGPVEAFLPVIMLAILFGLSMDYQVFLVSRMHEEWVHTGDNEYAVTRGQATTGRVITAAAAIMICVFVAFVFGGQRVIAEFGIGLAAAVFLDAFVLRTVLVPAAMHLFGPANWWLPGWLDRILPHLSVEPADEPHELPVPADEVVGAQPLT